MRSLVLSGLALAIVSLLAGCGGGGSAGSVGAGGDQVINTSGLSITAKAGAQPQILTTSANAITLMDFSGAAFTNVTTNPARNLESTFIVFGRDRNIWSLDTHAGYGTELTNVVTSDPNV